MKVSDQDADLFFELMFQLQVFVNQQLGILPDVSTLEEYLVHPTEQKLPIRDALYDNSHLIDQYVQQNPNQLSDDNLPDDLDALWKSLEKVERAASRVEITLHRSER